MKILFDLSYTQNANFYSGLYEYGKRIYLELVKEADVTLLLLKDAKIDETILNNSPNIIYLKAKKDSRKYFKEIKKNTKNFDRLFMPYQLIHHKILIAGNCELYFTIHDLAGITLASWGKINKEEIYYVGPLLKIKVIFKQLLRLSGLWKRYIIKNLSFNIKQATRIYTISNYVKREIDKLFDIEYKTKVFYSPPKILNITKESTLNYQNFFLFVSASRYTKNTYRGLRALDIIYDEGEKRKTIVVGRLPSSIYKRIKHKDKVICLDYVSTEDLEYLYKNAFIFIFPSLSEGFGYPPYEAMRYGTKVALSYETSLKEMYDTPSFFNPYSVEDIKEGIKRAYFLNNEDMRKNYERLKAKTKSDLELLLEDLKK